jgi:hypothetical protein
MVVDGGFTIGPNAPALMVLDQPSVPSGLHRPIVQKVTRASGRERKRSAGFVLSYGASVASVKLDPHGFIGGFDRMTIVCVHGDLDELAGLP